jgi:cytochrome c1
MGQVMTGPDLTSVLERWGNDTARIKAYIRNPVKAIEAGDPEAVKAFEAFKPTIMTPFPQLSDAELSDIVSYLRSPD